MTWFYLVVKLPRLIIFSVRHKNLKNQRKNYLKKLWGTCKVLLVFKSIVHYKSKIQLLQNQTLHLWHWDHLQLVHSFQGWMVTRMGITNSNFLMTSKLLPHKIVWKKAVRRQLFWKTASKECSACQRIV